MEPNLSEGFSSCFNLPASGCIYYSQLFYQKESIKQKIKGFSSNSIFLLLNKYKQCSRPVPCEMLSTSCRTVWSKSCLCTPRGTQALLSGYGGQDKSVRKAGEQEWNLPHDEAKAHFTPSVRQPKYYAWFVFPEVLSPEVRGAENPSPNEAQRASLQRRHLCTHWARWYTVVSPGATTQH